MKNITLAIDDEVLAKVRAYATEQKTTVNAIVRLHLEKLAAENDSRAEARRQLLRLAQISQGRLALDYVWNREELYDRSALRRHERPDLRRQGPKMTTRANPLSPTASFQNERICLSTQVLQEFYVAVQRTDRRSGVALTEEEAAEWVGWLEPFCEVVTDLFLVQRAIETSRRYRISYWDAAILAAAVRADAPIVYSEDLNHGQRYGDVQVINPFK